MLWRQLVTTIKPAGKDCQIDFLDVTLSLVNALEVPGASRASPGMVLKLQRKETNVFGQRSISQPS